MKQQADIVNIHHIVVYSVLRPMIKSIVDGKKIISSEDASKWTALFDEYHPRFICVTKDHFPQAYDMREWLDLKIKFTKNLGKPPLGGKIDDIPRIVTPSTFSAVPTFILAWYLRRQLRFSFQRFPDLESKMYTTLHECVQYKVISYASVSRYFEYLNETIDKIPISESEAYEKFEHSMASVSIKNWDFKEEKGAPKDLHKKPIEVKAKTLIEGLNSGELATIIDEEAAVKIGKTVLELKQLYDSKSMPPYSFPLNEYQQRFRLAWVADQLFSSLKRQDFSSQIGEYAGRLFYEKTFAPKQLSLAGYYKANMLDGFGLDGTNQLLWKFLEGFPEKAFLARDYVMATFEALGIILSQYNDPKAPGTSLEEALRANLPAVWEAFGKDATNDCVQVAFLLGYRAYLYTLRNSELVFKGSETLSKYVMAAAISLQATNLDQGLQSFYTQPDHHKTSERFTALIMEHFFNEEAIEGGQMNGMEKKEYMALVERVARTIAPFLYDQTYDTLQHLYANSIEPIISALGVRLGNDGLSPEGLARLAERLARENYEGHLRLALIRGHEMGRMSRASVVDRLTNKERKVSY